MSISASEGGPLASVIVPAYNVAPYIAQALDSLFRQTLADMEIIVVDDGSSDGTAEVLKGIETSHAGRTPCLQVIHQSNGGPSAARNAGLAVARGQYVGFLDADDLWYPEKLARHVALLEKRQSADLSFSWFRSIDQHGEATGFIGRPDAFSFADLVRNNPIVTTLVVARKQALVDAGGFDDTLSSHVDFDLWLRVAHLRPDNFAEVPEVLVDQRTRPGQITSDWRRMARNWEKVIQKARTLQPGIVEKVVNEARARQRLFLAKSAYRGGESRDALKLMLQAWRAHPTSVIRRYEGWSVSVAVLAAQMPQPLRVAIFGLATKLRKRGQA
ncbi:glycosyltransferase family 2 protein [Allohahella marinimesophila]|uniref:Glycosyltransferase n=1 Tax=Allohahella marinimesophila TaxID=1054972 RepID=A0ABP7PXU2_9GAMM